MPLTEVDMLDDIKTKWNIPVTLPMAVPWGKDDVVWLVGEVTRLRAEAKCADEEATTLANSDLATTEQVIRALRAEVAALRAACTLALRIMEQKNKVNVPSYVKTVTVDFAPEDIAVLRAALDPPVDVSVVGSSTRLSRPRRRNTPSVPSPG